MTISPTFYVRQTILTALQADAGVLAFIPADSLYPSKTPNNPAKPFGRYGAETNEPMRPSGWRGGEVSTAYHVWVGVTDAIPDPKTYCEQSVDAIAEAIDALPDCTVERTQLLEDASEPDLWHGVVQFTFTALAEI
ncbi:tail completion protein gp17 [Sphingobium fuliginis]|nr:DUF3168 domain-containing protein [Sphingobium fuliginis]